MKNEGENEKGERKKGILHKKRVKIDLFECLGKKLNL